MKNWKFKWKNTQRKLHLNKFPCKSQLLIFLIIILSETTVKNSGAQFRNKYYVQYYKYCQFLVPFFEAILSVCVCVWILIRDCSLVMRCENGFVRKVWMVCAYKQQNWIFNAEMDIIEGCAFRGKDHEWVIFFDI